jgi:hypothetical protein
MSIKNEVLTDQVITLEVGGSITNSHLVRCDLRQIPDHDITITDNVMDDCLFPDWWYSNIVLTVGLPR